MYETRRQPPRSPKITGGATALPASGQVKAIIRVAQPGHVPAGVKVRSRIDETLLTAEFDVASIDQVAADPLVLAISAAEPVQAAAPPPAGSQ